MLATILGILGCLGVCANGIHSREEIRTDTVILNSVDTTVNRLLQVNRILIIGNKVTRERIISRELSLTPADTISSKRLAQVLLKDKNKIYNLRLFNTVTVRVLVLTASNIDILVEVAERWYLFPEPIFELADRNLNEWYQNYNHDFSRVNYGIRLYHYNFRGRNEKLKLIMQFGFSRKFELSYQIPYIDRYQKQGLVFNLDYGEPGNLAYFTDDHILKYSQSTQPLKRTYGIGITYSYRKSFYETHSISVGYRSSSISDTIKILNSNYYKNGATSQQYGAISYSFNSDHRDVILYPLKGHQYAASLGHAGLGSSSVNLFEFSLSQARHWDLKRKFYLSNYTSAYVSTPNSQPYSLFRALGYRRQVVRGYEIYVIEGPKYILNKTTFKKRILFRTWRWEDFPIEQFRHIPLAIYVKGYMDLGYVQNYPYYQNYVSQDVNAPIGINTRLTNHLLAGAGGGVDIVTVYDLVFRFEYTFTQEGTRGFFFNIKKEF